MAMGTFKVPSPMEKKDAPVRSHETSKAAFRPVGFGEANDTIHHPTPPARGPLGGLVRAPGVLYRPNCAADRLGEMDLSDHFSSSIA